MKTLVTCMLCAAALLSSANVNAQEAAPMPSATIPFQMTLTVSVGGEVHMVLPASSGKWILADQAATSPVDVTIEEVAVVDKESGKAIEGETDIMVTIKGTQEGKTILQFVCVLDNGTVVDSRTVAVEVEK